MLNNILDLSQRALSATLHLSAWTGQRIDNTATRTVQTKHSTASDSGKFAKALLPKDALAAINTAHSRARQSFHYLTLPWLDDATRIFPASNLLSFREEMRKRREACGEAYDEFVRKYPEYLASGPARLGDLYHAREFPDADSVRNLFSFSLTIAPVASGDFRITNVTPEQEAELTAEYTNAAREQMGAAQRELWTRLGDVLRHFADTMATKDKIFHGSTVEKVVELAKRAPSLSLVPDSDLQRVCDDVLRRVSLAHADTYRADEWARQEAANVARDALRQVENKLAGAFV